MVCGKRDAAQRSALKFLKGLIDHARITRSNSPAYGRERASLCRPNTQLVDDPLGEYLDVLGCNEYVGWYDGPPEKADRLTWKVTLNKPLIISEFGGDALFGSSRRQSDEMDRGIPEGFVRASDRDVAKDSFAAGHVSVDSDRLSIATKAAAADSGFLQSQRIDLTSR